ncbi:helix-turn-helix transcriptional regulator [Primorskyibacter flagellatus]|nr:YafY family protein [Primorskyibacter flagellatus]
MSRTDRLLHLMQGLRSLDPPVTAARLARELDVTERTIYRDIATLRGLGAVIDGAAGFGYTVTEDASLPPLAFDDEELEALVLGLREVEAVADPHLAAAATAALSKLRGRLPERQAHRLQHAVLTAHRFAPPPQATVDLRSLRKAAWDEMEIRIAYRDKNACATTRQVRPLQIVFFQDSHCLLAWCCLRQDFRAFRLDRIAELEVTGPSFRPHRTSLLRAHLALLRGGDPAMGETPRTGRGALS